MAVVTEPERLGAFLAGAGVRHFSPATDPKLAEPVPPDAFWEKLGGVLRVADWLRDRVGPLRVTSAYRTPQHNEAVGGAPNSRHVYGDALDLALVEHTLTPAELASVAATHPNAARMGIGAYRDDGHVHIDTRGTEARWSVPEGYWP